MKHWSWPMKCFIQLKVQCIHRITFICSTKGLLAGSSDSPFLIGLSNVLVKESCKQQLVFSAVRKRRRSQGCSGLGSSTHSDGSIGFCLHFFLGAFHTKHIHPCFCQSYNSLILCRSNLKTGQLYCEVLIALNLRKVGLNKLSGWSRFRLLTWICLYLDCTDPKNYSTNFT